MHILKRAIASVSGFGIGSLLAPLLAVKAGTKLADRQIRPS